MIDLDIYYIDRKGILIEAGAFNHSLDLFSSVLYREINQGAVVGVYLCPTDKLHR